MMTPGYYETLPQGCLQRIVEHCVYWSITNSSNQFNCCKAQVAMHIALRLILAVVCHYELSL